MKLPLRFIVTGALLALASLSLSQQPDKAAQAELAKKYPSLRIQAKVGVRTRLQDGSSFWKNMFSTPEVIVESASTQPMAAASATFLLITMNTAEKYVRGDEELTIATNESLDIPAVPRGVRRNFEFEPLKTRFDTYRDKSNLGGDVYKYFIMAVFSDDKQFLHFETNCPALDKHLKAHPELRQKFLGMKPGEKFRTRFQ
jgi:hypothetical protein